MKEIKENQVQHARSFTLLRYVRDTQPSEEQLLQWAEDCGLRGNYFVLRKGGVLQIEEGQVVIAPERYRGDRKGVQYGNSLYWLDRERKDIF